MGRQGVLGRRIDAKDEELVHLAKLGGEVRRGHAIAHLPSSGMEGLAK